MNWKISVLLKSIKCNSDIHIFVYVANLIATTSLFNLNVDSKKLFGI